MFTTTLQAAWRYFPVGSGFGTFVPIYGMLQTPATVWAEYVNHAHDDWLEIFLEGGVPAALIAAGFLAWFVLACRDAWRRPSPGTSESHQMLQRAATIAIALILLHSLVDYPMRTIAIMTVFGLASALAAGIPPSRSAGGFASSR
jgi:O-antigen ligase